MNYNILRANDIRGAYPSEINEDATRRIIKAFAYYIKENYQDKCMVGHDNRLSSESLNKVVIETLLSSGIDVIDIGLCTTPMLNYASIVNNMPYGIMITASHNKATDNGLKLFGENFLHIRQNELERLYKMIKEGLETEGSGTLKKIDIKDDYVGMLVSKFKQNNKKVVIDCGNGTASVFVKDIFSKIFPNINYINSESDGSFPIHNPDPNVDENLKWLKDIVKLRGADVGIAFDGDCDRVGIVDENGDTITTDYLIAIYAKHIIPYNDNKNVIIDVKCSSAIDGEIKKMGGNPLMVKNGSAYIESVMFDTPALIGGEYSGHVFFKDDYYGYDDGYYAGLRFAEILLNTNLKASELTKDMPKYESSPEIRLTIDDNIKFQIIDKIKEYVKEKNYNASFIDGVRVNYSDGFALVRASNTGPSITARFEASTKEELEIRQKEFLDLIDKFK